MTSSSSAHLDLGQSSERRLKVFFLFSIISCALIVLYTFDPSSSTGIYPPCPFKSLTGLYCPGCGALRGLHALLNGDIRAALDFNPLIVVSLPYLLYSFYRYCSPVVLGRRVQPLLIKPSWIWTFMTVVFAFWIIRNIPYFPFNALAP